MVSWSEDSGSSEGSHGRYYQHATSGSDDGIVQIPATTDDSEFEGKDYVLCHEHRKRAERLVAFEGIHTGRRFLACIVKDGKNCGLVEWVDPSWPATMENALSKLWDIYEESKRNRTEDNLMNSFVVHNLTQEKIKLQASYDKLVGDVQALLDENERRAHMERKPDESKLQEKYDVVKNLTVSQASVIRNMKLKLVEEKTKLQAHVDEIEKVVEQTKAKLNGIKAILDE
ncbi:hypothetical protein CFC21_015281 [Triticum aestivum]|uniref:GRF-type domain-containing protein n=2 Tax=Triticum aestivum TaxID=4565 RepID=A0A3B6ARV9_WHEAT|nr:hypothetical protein CFC21_015281 [Triticum aestivum]